MCFQNGEEKHTSFLTVSPLYGRIIHVLRYLLVDTTVKSENPEARFLFWKAWRLWFHEDCHHPPVPSLTFDAYDYSPQN